MQKEQIYNYIFSYSTCSVHTIFYFMVLLEGTRLAKPLWYNSSAQRNSTGFMQFSARCFGWLVAIAIAQLTFWYHAGKKWKRNWVISLTTYIFNDFQTTHITKILFSLFFYSPDLPMHSSMFQRAWKTVYPRNLLSIGTDRIGCLCFQS